MKSSQKLMNFFKKPLENQFEQMEFMTEILKCKQRELTVLNEMNRLLREREDKRKAENPKRITEGKKTKAKNPKKRNSKTHQGKLLVHSSPQRRGPLVKREDRKVAKQ